MDPILLTVLFKGTGMTLAILGGIVIAWYGYRLYKDGAGHGRDQIGFELGKIKAKANTVGSVVMSTAFMWAALGWMLSPNMEKKGDTIRVYSMTTPAGDLKALALSTKSPANPSEKSDPEKLKVLFSEAIANTRKGSSVPLATLDGKPASIDTSGITTELTGAGEKVFFMPITAGTKKASLRYEALLIDGSVTFVPAGVDLAVAKK